MLLNFFLLFYCCSKLYNDIPAGTTYITGSTSLNGNSISDVNGNMPFTGWGGYINSISNRTGVISPGAFAKVIYQVKVTASTGDISNSAAADVIINNVSYIQYSNTVITPTAPGVASNN